MVRTRKEAAPQAQDYVWGWRDVPAPVRLDGVCGYLDAASMGILEICGKNCLGDAQRAWQAKAAGVARGSLANVSTKQLVAAQGRVDALVGGPFDDFRWQPYEDPDVNFDEFAFSVTLVWQEDGTKRASFPFMRMTDRTSEMGHHSSMSTNMFLVSPEAPGQDILAPRLRRAISDEEGKRWVPTAYLTCTRRKDGATIRMAHFYGIEDDEEVDVYWEYNPSIRCGSLDNGRLLVAGLEDKPEDEPLTTFHLVFDSSTGRLRAICSTFYHNQNEVDGYELYRCLHARLDESVRD